MVSSLVQPRASGRFCRRLGQAFTGTIRPIRGVAEPRVTAILEGRQPRRPEGATVDEVKAATGWQPHTVRGVFAGALKKKLGLAIVATKEERGRVYRIAAAGR